jgi:histidinol-phosphate/aromatic aminotransferase/cobyric acid decarboxylase-like protein
MRRFLRGHDESGARVHGGPRDAELQALGVGAGALLDFSSSTNPYGPHPAVLEALRTAAVERYPDSSALRARQALGALLGIPATELVLGNGAADLLWTLARCLLGSSDRALIVEPTFSEFRAAARACGAGLDEWRAVAEAGFAPELSAIAEQARASGASVIYLCSPNTPTGSACSATEIQSWATRHSELMIVLDQSFLTLSECYADATVSMPDNVVRVRSLTKDHGIPGARVGYLLGSAELCRAVECNRPAWTTSAFAQAATLACVQHDDFVRESREQLLRDRRELARELAAIGIETLPSRTTFLLARAPRVSDLRVRLLSEDQILVRDCESFGLPGFMRLAAKPANERARLIAALRGRSRC